MNLCLNLTPDQQKFAQGFAAEFAHILDTEINKRVEERLAERREALQEAIPTLPAGSRRLTVTYTPGADINDLDYVHLQTEGNAAAKEYDDAVALCLASAKALAQNNEEVDEDECGKELMITLGTQYANQLVNLLIGGVN